MELFDHALAKQLEKEAPLADRMRPRTLEEFVGQSHILGSGRLLRRAIQADQLSSLIFYGPPGTGKTTLARIIANTTKASFLSINAVLSGVKEIRENIARAEKVRSEYEEKTILFIDEVHRFNKAQQDALLPHVEKGVITLIGATTENPYFEVNKALVSRSRIFQLKSLRGEDLENIIDYALKNEERGYGKMLVKLDLEAKKHLVSVANGDARAALNALELAVVTSKPDKQGVIHIDLAVAEESIQQRAVLYDKDGDVHFDTISAFIKSLRGSDPDAALYWMAKMIYAGEDPKFIFRRMIIFAAEDVGMADPNALQITVAASQAFDYVGMPEGRFHLAEACLYLSTAAKSNSSFAFFDALKSVKSEMEKEVPNHLKDGNRDKKGLGHGEGYLYPHAYQDHWVAQQYLPEALQGRMFYEPSMQGFEKKINQEVKRKREAYLAAMIEEPAQDQNDSHWRARTLGNSEKLLAEIRERIFSMLDAGREEMILNLNAGSGLLVTEAIRLAPEGTIYAFVSTNLEEETLIHQFRKRSFLSQPIIKNSSQKGIDYLIQELIKEGVKFDAIIGKNPFPEKMDQIAFLQQIKPLFAAKGKLVFSLNIPAKAQRFSNYLSNGVIDSDLYERLLDQEQEIYSDPKNKLLNWDENLISSNLKKAGFITESIQVETFRTDIYFSKEKVAGWFSTRLNQRLSYGEHLSKSLSEEEVKLIYQGLLRELGGQVRSWKTTWVFVKTRVEKSTTEPSI